jgi:hypothetical protein
MPINLVILFVLVFAVGVFAYYFSRISAVKENYELEQFKALFEFATEGIIIANKEGAYCVGESQSPSAIWLYRK